MAQRAGVGASINSHQQRDPLSMIGILSKNSKNTIVNNQPSNYFNQMPTQPPTGDDRREIVVIERLDDSEEEPDF